MPLNFATDRTPEQAADGPTRSAARPQPQPPRPPLACSPSKNLVDCVPAKNNAYQRSPNPDERSARDPQISIDRARSNRRPFLPAVSSLGGFRTPTPHPARPSFKGPASETLHQTRHRRRRTSTCHAAARGGRGNFDARQSEPDHFYPEACFKATTSDKIICQVGRTGPRKKRSREERHV